MKNISLAAIVNARARRVQDLIYDLQNAFGVICLNVDKDVYVSTCTSRFRFLLCLALVFWYRNVSGLVLRRFDEPLVEQVASAFDRRSMSDRCVEKFVENKPR